MIDLFGRKRIAELERQNHLLERKASDLACDVIQHRRNAEFQYAGFCHEKLAREHLGGSVERATPEQAAAAWAFADVWIAERGRVQA